MMDVYPNVSNKPSIIVMMITLCTILIAADAQNQLKTTVSFCADTLTSAQRDFNSSLVKAEDGSLSLNPKKRIPCRLVKKLEKQDCRCLLEEALRNADSLGEKEKQKLEFMELLNTDTRIAKTCKVSETRDCSNAADRIISSFYPDKNTKLGSALRSRYKSCESKAKQLVAKCRNLTGNNNNETSVNECCGALESSGLDQDCICLILENDKAAANGAGISRSGQALITLLKSVTTNDQVRSTCGAALGNPDCTGVAKALEVASSTAGDADLTDPIKCEKAATDAMKGCVSTLQGGGGGGGGGVESLVCCSKVEGLAKGGCGCNLGTEKSIDKDLRDFIQNVRSGDRILQVCPNSGLEGTRNCTSSSSAATKVFGECHIATEEAKKTCGPLVEAAGKHKKLKQCCKSLSRFAESGCLSCVKEKPQYNESIKKLSDLMRNTAVNQTCQVDYSKHQSNKCRETADGTPLADSCDSDYHGCVGVIPAPDYTEEYYDGTPSESCDTIVNQAMGECKETMEKISKGELDLHLSYQTRLNTSASCCPKYVKGSCPCDTQSLSCCNQLDGLEKIKSQNCICDILNKEVETRDSTVDFVKFVREDPDIVWGTCGFVHQQYRNQFSFTRNCNPLGAFGPLLNHRN